MTIDRVTEERLILELDAAFLDALLERDVAVVDRDLPDDFLAVFPDGRVADKQMELENVKHAEVESYTTDEVQVHWYADTVAVVNFRMTLNMKERGQKRVRDLHVYIKRDGKWQMITGQVTPILQT
ncbi:nuclear transport factor 2 family protein [Pseudanabaena sp. FACHB-2040]|uniref:nuclear transport factor 2 family protein n=1 Tax=Pseudanabaena sp. FACHB-2040 TaxID=2692859 RepID=UPI00168333E9|nr:nuclear transport factor 2 family protein [Pseudanabaena sp. FACHB-2040]MBD2259714.1 nuclear transport factor 2 family protein [Pseudanabaena sp. FACHB-2040]